MDNIEALSPVSRAVWQQFVVKAEQRIEHLAAQVWDGYVWLWWILSGCVADMCPVGAFTTPIAYVDQHPHTTPTYNPPPPTKGGCGVQACPQGPQQPTQGRCTTPH